MKQIAIMLRRNFVVLARRYSTAGISSASEWEAAKPYESIPGPKQIPLLGNIPALVIGQYAIKSNDFVDVHRRYANLHVKCMIIFQSHDNLFMYYIT